ncbi:MAG: toxin-antitoxin system HicB family antitoxin [Actinomycetia bacterium]|nr:toxin-antitoxin system HicB family antitoxin [Actinomycetes bacterium]
MELSRYLRRLAEDLEKVTALADEHTRETTARLVSAIEPSLRMVLVEAISDTAALVTADLDDVVAVVRMEGRDPVVSVEQAARTEPIPTPAAEEGEEDSARITVRLPQSLKQRAEAHAGEVDQSLNTWIVQTIRRATSDAPGPGFPFGSAPRSSRRVTGWA